MVKFINLFSEILNVLKSYPTIGILLTTVAGFIWGAFKFSKFLKEKQFKNYHELIGDLVDENKSQSKTIKADRQIATIYELRNFPSYYCVTDRILKGLKDAWSNEKIDKATLDRIIEEIDLTLKFINNNWIVRKLIKITKKY